ncbi:ParB N-terminal domain-containing protein [Marinomonas communis]|uniref:ParB-like nuclease family protein n=1 Tax=Marinomonas communis TaxID=28254 RepID=A0A4R6X3S1_9GAMM|nr:ParB N-terminal domain-containing protein [Marinomonas communis]TDR05952.1 ParB-like nuclease family protein [Marinomonas communis]
MSLMTATFTEVFEKLEQEQANGKAEPKVDSLLHLEQIHEAIEVFQPRDLANDTASKEQHIRNLMDAIFNESGNRLDPIVVWWSGFKWYVLDGHHRLMAYKRVQGLKKIKILEIPVRVFSGSLVLAMAESTRLNSKDKLAMTRDDKFNRAWLFIAMDKGLSKREVATICKVGSATVSRMRKKLNEIRELQPHDWQSVALGMSWKEAMAFNQNGRVIDDGWEDRLALEWSKRIAKTFGNKPQQQPEVFVRALEMYSPHMLKGIAQHLKEFIEDDPYGFDDEDEYLEEGVEGDF